MCNDRGNTSTIVGYELGIRTGTSCKLTEGPTEVTGSEDGWMKMLASTSVQRSRFAGGGREWKNRRIVVAASWPWLNRAVVRVIQAT